MSASGKKTTARKIFRYLAGKILRVSMPPFLKMTGGHLLTTQFRVVSVPQNMNPYACASLILGRYEAQELEIMRMMKPADRVLEVGANIGYTASIAMETILNRGGDIVCVEPNPEVQEALRINVNRVHAADPSKIPYFITAAIGQSEGDLGTARFNVQPNLSAGLVAHTGKRDTGHETIVKVFSLNALIADHKPQILICDAEGAEIDMVKEQRALKEKGGAAFEGIEQIAIELHEFEVTKRPETPDDILKDLRACGFETKARRGNTYYLKRVPA